MTTGLPTTLGDRPDAHRPTGPWVVYWNGRFVPEHEVQISPWDRGFILADAAFEATRTYRHVPFHLDWHLDRLFATFEYLRLEPGLTRRDFEELTLAVLDRNRIHLRPHDDVILTHRITRGITGGPFASAPESPPTVLIWCRPIVFGRFSRYYDHGLVIDVPTMRIPAAGGLDPRAKTHNRLVMTLAHVEIGHLRPDALPLLVDTNGHVTESDGANVMYVMGGRLVTPPDEVALEGVTRRVLLQIAPQIGIPVDRRPVHLRELSKADEAIVTATSYAVLPVRMLDGRALSPIPGPVTAALTAAFSDHAGVDIIEQSRLV
jgi:branched-chain amino acid aminotransferase